VARAGRTGTAISFVTGDELPYLLDLQLFLGRSLVLSATYENRVDISPDYTSEIVLGSVPPNVLGMDMENVQSILQTNATVNSMFDSSKNAFKLYMKTRVGASNESYTRAKEVTQSYIGIHPLVVEQAGVGEIKQQELLRSISLFRPSEVFFFCY
jgi:ATP-dependent RNA helicase DDX54/DBP10